MQTFIILFHYFITCFLLVIVFKLINCIFDNNLNKDDNFSVFALHLF